MSLWQYLTVKWDTGQVAKLPKTITPVDGLYQRSSLILSPVPLLLAQGAGSKIRPISGQQSVFAVGTMKARGMTFFRVYLDEGTFIHLAVEDTSPATILESRVYQSYQELDIPYELMAEARQFGGSDDQSAEFWLLDNPDPSVGGIIGCPTMYGKQDDGPIAYARTWAKTDGRRIAPERITEYILKSDGVTGVSEHQTMHYGRGLDPETDEFLLVSMVMIDGTRRSLNVWLGMDIKVNNLTVYPSA